MSIDICICIKPVPFLVERPAVAFPERGFFILGGFMGTLGYFDIAIYVKKYVCQIEGDREVERQIEHYNLDVMGLQTKP